MDDRNRTQFSLPFSKAVLWSLAIAITATATAAEIHLKNGDVIEGKPVPIRAMTRVEIERENANNNHYYPILMIHSGIKRHFVPAKQVNNIDHAGGLINLEEYDIAQKFGARRKMLQTLGGVRVNQEFDEYGRRTVSFQVNGEIKPVVQGITKINPQYLTVSAMTDYAWEHALSTTSLDEKTLSSILNRTIDRQNAQERMGLAVFYMQAGLYVRAGQELDAIMADFPELKDTAEKVITQLRSTQAQRLLIDLRRRRDTGQHRLAGLALKNFPIKNMSADILKELNELDQELNQYKNQLDQVRLSLTMLQRTIEDETKRTMLESLRSSVRDDLDAVGLPRMEAFLKLRDDDSLTAEQKLALAYSGWMLGSAHAITDLDQTLRYWQARRMMVAYLLTEDTAIERDLLLKLATMEGITPTSVARILTLLGPVIETPGIKPGVAHRIEVEERNTEAKVVYHVLLPQEYSPNRAYPLIVSLHPLERGAEAELSWWGGTENSPGQSQRHGSIVIAPEYIDEKLTAYDYAAKSHYITLKAIRDACRRFHVNSDKIFLSGHGMGGDAAFDIGMSHPDVFAGVIPISALAQHYCKWYWRNAKHVSWYLVSGELCRNSLVDPDHSAVLGRMLRYGHEFDLIYAEYVGRGYEHYYEEIHHLFDWMQRQERKKNIKEVEATILRPVDNRFYWIKAQEMPANVLSASVIDNTGGNRTRVRPMTLEATILDGSDDHTTININSGAKRHILNLSPELIDYNKRLWVRNRGKRIYNDFPEANIEVQLNDFKERADRQNLVWTQIIAE